MMDAHCHLNDPAYDNDRDEVVKRAKDITIIDAGIDARSDSKSLEISRRYKNVYSCLGMEPCITDFERISRMIRDNRESIVGIGEVGLDYKECRERDDGDFRMFIRLANELRLPLVVHSRWAVKPVINILEEEEARSVVMHAFSGNEKEALRVVENGWFVSIPTSIKWAEQKVLIAGAVPIKSILTETDSPLMWENRNEPANVAFVLEKIAEIKNISVQEADKTISANGKRVFGID
jgi:TatD DNase family protein